MLLRTYTFFDVALEMTLPGEVLDQWDLLYGRFADSQSGAEKALRVSWSPRSGDIGLLNAGPAVREIQSSKILLHLQDIVQNHVLASVQSHLLWHGAAWCVGGQGVVVLGESGLGKTTLSLAEEKCGGCVLSDEIAAWHTECARLVPFPRALAVRPDSLSLLRLNDPYPHLFLDEEKAIVPIAHGEKECCEAGIPIGAVVFLEWPVDKNAGSNTCACELCVHAPDDRWREKLESGVPGVEVVRHPDGGNWWRCSSKEPIKTAVIQKALESGGAVLSGFHHGARRAPTFSGEPEIVPLGEDAAALSMSYLVNGRAMAEAVTAPRLMVAVKAALQNARCVRCVPGELERTRQAIRAPMQIEE